MTDSTTKIADADAARLAWDRYVGPMFEVHRAEYVKRMAEEAVKPMEGRALAAVQSLAHALKVLANMEAEMRAAILEGDVARRAAENAAALARMSPEARRVASY